MMLLLPVFALAEAEEEEVEIGEIIDAEVSAEESEEEPEEETAPKAGEWNFPVAPGGYGSDLCCAGQQAL